MPGIGEPGRHHRESEGNGGYNGQLCVVYACLAHMYVQGCVCVRVHVLVHAPLLPCAAGGM